MGGAYHGWSDQLGYSIRVPGSKFTQAHGVPLYLFKHTQEFFPNDLDSLERVLHLDKFVIVRRKQDLRLTLWMLMKIFRYCPCDTDTVVGTRSSSYFIKKNQTTI